MTRYAPLLQELPHAPKYWLIISVACFIGSNLLEILLKLDHYVIGNDNFATGHQSNLNALHVDSWCRQCAIPSDYP